MDFDEIIKLRQQVNEMYISENVDYEELLKKSQELDMLIVAWMKESIIKNNDGDK